MAFFPKPAAGSWTENWPELGTAPVNYEDSIDPEHFKLEQEAIFKKTWLNVGRVERLPKKGSYFTREMPSVGPGTSVIIVKDKNETRSAPSTTCAATAETSWCGTTTRARRCRAPAASSPASTTPGATASTAT